MSDVGCRAPDCIVSDSGPCSNMSCPRNLQRMAGLRKAREDAISDMSIKKEVREYMAQVECSLAEAERHIKWLEENPPGSKYGMPTARQREEAIAEFRKREEELGYPAGSYHS